MGMPKSRHAHRSRIFVNSNWNLNLDHGPFSSPGNMKSVFQRAMADRMHRHCPLNVPAPFTKMINGQPVLAVVTVQTVLLALVVSILVGNTSLKVANIKCHIKTISRFVWPRVNRIRVVRYVMK